MELTKQIQQAKELLQGAKNILIGAGAGLSTAAGYTYSGERFKKYFADFEEKYNFHDMYSGGFYPYKTAGEFWAFWARNILCNRYDQPESEVHKKLLQIVRDKNYFTLKATTVCFNVQRLAIKKLTTMKKLFAKCTRQKKIYLCLKIYFRAVRSAAKL